MRMGRQNKFVFVEPKSIKKSYKHGTKLRCQTCFTPFNTEQDLREHVGNFQREGQRLAARMMEVQMHLAPTLDPWSTQKSRKRRDDVTAENEDNSEDSDEDDDDDDDDDDEIGDDENGPETIRCQNKPSLLTCPHRICNKKSTNGFKDHLALQRHFQSHIWCQELCIFCRAPLLRVRKYMRHTCHMQKDVDEAKQFYTKERRSQLSLYSNGKLDMLLRHRSEQAMSKKRSLADADQNSSDEHIGKRHVPMLGAAHSPWQVPFMESESLDREVEMQLPVDAAYGTAGNSEMPPVLDVGARPRQSRQWAPIFGDVTITPSYIHSSSLLDYPVILNTAQNYPVESLDIPGNHSQASGHDHLLGGTQMPY